MAGPLGIAHADDAVAVAEACSVGELGRRNQWG